MSRKKVAVLLPWMKMGGTNKIGLSFMRELSEYCDVTLILSERTGELLEELPDNIELIVDEMRGFKDILFEDIRKVRIGKIVRDMAYYIRVKCGRDNIDNWKYIVDRHGLICDKEFDSAISYHGQSPERLLNLLYRINAGKKVVWIHGENSFPEKKLRPMRKYYAMADHFFFVSNPTMESFERVFPFDRSKATVYYNPIEKERITALSDVACEPEMAKDSFNILTVGRVSSEKGQDMIPPTVKKLLEKGHNVRWYVIGDGNMLPSVKASAKALSVEDRVVFLGTRTNPYCYMKACDLYVQPSYTEGYSTTICEAGILGCAVVGTKPSGGIYDQLTDGYDGLIVEATCEGLVSGIETLICDSALRESFKSRIVEKNFEGKGEIEKFLIILR